MAFAYTLSENFLSSINPFFLQAEIASAVALGIGIVFESERFPPSVHKSAFWFVVIGVVLETVFSILLFASEERIGSLQHETISAQQSKIIELETRLAPRFISSEARKRIADKIKLFAGTRFDMAVINDDPEALSFLLQIVEILELSSWVWTEYNHTNGPFMEIYKFPSKPNIGHLIGTGLTIQVNADHDAELSPAARALYDALKVEGVGADIPAVAHAAIPNHDAIHIVIGKKVQ